MRKENTGKQRRLSTGHQHSLTRNPRNLTRKQAKPAARFALTAGLATGALTMGVLLRSPSMATILSGTTAPVTDDSSAQASTLASTSTTARSARPALRTKRLQRVPAAPERPTAGTRALFQYHRDDNTPDKVTRVRIDAGRQAATPVSPNIFGNFIEHLGGVVYQALWAQVLLNPNLERIEAQDVRPEAWSLYGAASWQEGGCRSPHCVRLAPDARIAGLSQHVSLSAQRATRYEVTLYVRAAKGGGKIRVALAREAAVTPRRRTARVEPPAVEARQDETQAILEVRQADWKTVRCTLTVPKSATPDENLWRFAVQHEGGQAVDVDQIEMFPTDNIDGFDPDVLGRTRIWDVPLLRYPGGNFASGYHWQDGVGPRASRPTERNPAWGGIEPNHVGTHEFMTFARLTHATPQLTVNAGDGTPQEAADWVRYCNAPATETWGRRRAQNGAAKPFNVRIWEIGNELYGGWQIGHAEAQENADRFVHFRDAMLDADPNLRLLATGKGDEFTAAGLERDRVWNRALLKTAAQQNGRAPDWISLHPLVPLPDYAKNATYEEQYESALAHPAFLDNTLIPNVMRQIQDVEGPNPRTRIALTEWGIIVGGANWQQSPNHDTLSGAIYNALALNAMLRNSDWVTLANMTALLHGGGIKKWHGVVFVDPQYYTQQLYTLARPNIPVATTTTGPGSDVPARGKMPAVPDVPDVDVFAARAQQSGKLVVFAVNRHLSEARPLRLQVDGFKARTVKAVALSGDPRARNTIEAPDTVTPQPLPVPDWPQSAGADWQITLPPHSLVVLTLER